MAWMSDEEFIYRQDIKEKKAAGRGAFHKKGGSKSKKCNFPSDYMTRKEKQALNGEVMSYNPNKFYSYAEFKQLPMEYQIKYINSLLTRYNCSFAAIAKYVFQVSDVGLRNHFTRQKQLQYINMPAKGIGKALQAGNEKLREDVEKALWPNHDEEIQNESFEVTLVGGGSKYREEAPKELTLQEKIDQAAETVKLYESRGMEMTPELINQIYEEKTDMSFAMAMNEVGILPSVTTTLTDGDPKKPEDSKDNLECKTFLITTNKLDDQILDMIHRLFDGRKYELTITVALEEG